MDYSIIVPIGTKLTFQVAGELADIEFTMEDSFRRTILTVNKLNYKDVMEYKFEVRSYSSSQRWYDIEVRNKNGNYLGNVFIMDLFVNPDLLQQGHPFFEPIDTPVSVNTDRCTCSSLDLLRYGCKCGYIQRVREI